METKLNLEIQPEKPSNETVRGVADEQMAATAQITAIENASPRTQNIGGVETYLGAAGLGHSQDYGYTY